MQIEAAVFKRLSTLGTRARAFYPPRNKTPCILSTILLFGMFLTTLEQRFLYFNTLCVSFSISKYLEPHFLKPGSLGSGVGSALVIRVHNRKTLEPVLSHAVAFSTYFEDGGSHFP